MEEKVKTCTGCTQLLIKLVCEISNFKGRTGTMICIWLIESGECKTAKEALLKFGDRRTNWDKGSTFQGTSPIY